MNIGDSFVDVGSSNPHLWVVIARASRDEVCIVNITTQPWDKTCAVQEGEHPFLLHESYVWYAKARTAKDADLHTLLGNGLLRLHNPAELPLLRKIQRGAVDSDHTPQDIQDIVRSLLNSEL